jgi:predicted transcriptional regulator
MMIYRRFAEILIAKTKTVFDEIDQDAEARAIAEAEADVAAGRVVPHELTCPVPSAATRSLSVRY